MCKVRINDQKSDFYRLRTYFVHIKDNSSVINTLIFKSDLESTRENSEWL